MYGGVGLSLVIVDKRDLIGSGVGQCRSLEMAFQNWAQQRWASTRPEDPNIKHKQLGNAGRRVATNV